MSVIFCFCCLFHSKKCNAKTNSFLDSFYDVRIYEHFYGLSRRGGIGERNKKKSGLSNIFRSLKTVKNDTNTVPRPRNNFADAKKLICLTEE